MKTLVCGSVIAATRVSRRSRGLGRERIDRRTHKALGHDTPRWRLSSSPKILFLTWVSLVADQDRP